MSYSTLQILFFGTSFAVALLVAVPLGSLFRIREEPRGYNSLDGVRGMAAIAVATCHINQHLLTFFGFGELPTNGNRIGGLAVQIFFALTAFLFTRRVLGAKLQVRRFYVQRIRRIMPLYLFASAATICICVHYSPLPLEGYGKLLRESLAVVSFGVFGAPSSLHVQGYNAISLIGVAWSLSYELKFYVLLPVLFYLYARAGTVRQLTAAASILACIGAFLILKEPIWPYFVPGIIVAMVAHEKPRFSEGWKTFFCIASIPLTVLAVVTDGYYSWPHLLLALAIFFCLCFGEPRLLARRAFALLGQISYSVYLVHYLILVPALENFYRYHGPSWSPTSKFLFAVLINLAVIPAACMCYRLIELPGMGARKKPAREERVRLAVSDA